jgi:small conductance mechanosensitive channel
MIRRVLALFVLSSLFVFAPCPSSAASASASAVAVAQEPLPTVGLAPVDEAVAEYVATEQALGDASDDDRSAAAARRNDAKRAAVAAIDAALGEVGAGTDVERTLNDLRFQVTGEVADAGALVRAITRQLELASSWIAANGTRLGFKLVVVVLIYFAFRVLASIGDRAVRKALSNPKVRASSLLKEFVVGVAHKAVMAIGLLVILGQLGVEVGPILAGLGVAGFVLGFALQDTLGNFAAGLMILFYRPYDVGDVVDAGGVKGSVVAMSLVSTTIKTPDNQQLIVPNSKIWGGVITNVTAADTRRVDLVFGIGYGDDIGQAERVLTELVEQHPLCLKEPGPTIKLHELADSSVNFIVRPWVKTSDYWTVYWDLTRQVKETFDREGISIPFPQRDLHVHQVVPV